MAKDLPYFKFNISEWNDGDVTICSFEAQGLFINLCSIYWSQEGNLSFARAKRRFSVCNATAWDELVKEGIIKLDGDDVIINFLDEQLEERGKQSKINSQNASLGWEKRRLHATALPSHSEPTIPACNIEEKREEEKRTEENKEEVWPTFEDFWNKYDKKVGKPKALGYWKKINQGARTDIMAHLDKYLLVEQQFRKDPERYLKHEGWKDEVIIKTHENGNRNGFKTSVRSADAVIPQGKEFGQF